MKEISYVLQGIAGKPYELLKPTQAPINPPYKTACQLKKSNLLDQSSCLEIGGVVERVESLQLRTKQEEDRDEEKSGVEESQDASGGVPLLEDDTHIYVAKARDPTESDSAAIKEDRICSGSDNAMQEIMQGMSEITVTGGALRAEPPVQVHKGEWELYSEDQGQRASLDEVTPVRLTGGLESSEGLDPPLERGQSLSAVAITKPHRKEDSAPN